MIDLPSDGGYSFERSGADCRSVSGSGRTCTFEITMERPTETCGCWASTPALRDVTLGGPIDRRSEAEMWVLARVTPGDEHREGVSRELDH